MGTASPGGAPSRAARPASPRRSELREEGRVSAPGGLCEELHLIPQGPSLCSAWRTHCGGAGPEEDRPFNPSLPSGLGSAPMPQVTQPAPAKGNVRLFQRAPKPRLQKQSHPGPRQHRPCQPHAALPSPQDWPLRCQTQHPRPQCETALPSPAAPALLQPNTTQPNRPGTAQPRQARQSRPRCRSPTKPGTTAPALAPANHPHSSPPSRTGPTGSPWPLRTHRRGWEDRRTRSGARAVLVRRCRRSPALLAQLSRGWAG